MTEKTGRVDIAGAELFYRERGDGGPVLFIHGGGTTSELWGECFARVGEFAHAIGYDQRSFGRSTGDLGVRISRHGDDAAELIARLSISPATVVGHSFGASIGLDLAARYPDRVSALVLLEPPIDFRLLPSLGMLRLTFGIQLRRLIRDERSASDWLFRKVTAYRGRGTSAFEALPRELQEICLANAPALVASYEYTPEASGRHLPGKGIRSLDCDVTCITGDESWPPFVRTTRYVAKTVPKARLINAPGASHVLPYDAPEVIVEAVREAALARVGSPAGRSTSPSS
jgi:pimeloyl-ACP methyl ester carboxylesterase